MERVIAVMKMPEVEWLWYVFGVVVLVAFIVLIVRAQMEHQRRETFLLEQKEASRIATIEETTTFTNGGIAAVALLSLFNLFMFVATFSGSVIQSAALGTVWTAGNILLGIGAIIGRSRKMAVYRAPQHEG